ncbi:hypothetical protein ACVMHW_000338 [Bradyrhizobium diazoefficiens]
MPTTPISSIVPVSAASSVADAATPDLVLQAGSVVDARVVSVLADNLVRIAIANLSLDVMSEVALSPGQNLQLAVSQKRRHDPARRRQRRRRGGGRPGHADAGRGFAGREPAARAVRKRRPQHLDAIGAGCCHNGFGRGREQAGQPGAAVR